MVKSRKKRSTVAVSSGGLYAIISGALRLHCRLTGSRWKVEEERSQSGKAEAEVEVEVEAEIEGCDGASWRGVLCCCHSHSGTKIDINMYMFTHKLWNQSIRQSGSQALRLQSRRSSNQLINQSQKQKEY